MRRLLMIAFHYPPASGTSGVQRALRFSNYLGKYDWQPLVLTANSRAFSQTSDDLLPDVPQNAVVLRAQAWDAMRHFSIAGKYPTTLALPDRWSSWFFDAQRVGRAAIRRYRPDAIWSTYPIATAHKIAASLAHWSGLPLVADFRDPMAQDGYPADERTWQSFKQIEESVFREASATVFTTPGAAAMYTKRFPECRPSIDVIENGYEESVFVGIEDHPEPLEPGRVTVLHSGVVYPSERDPSFLFSALLRMKTRHGIDGKSFAVRFRAPVHTDLVKRLAIEHNVSDMIEVLPQVPYADAIQEMVRADALLILQAPNCNAQIPAKLYEYLRSGRPILTVSDKAGDTASAVRAAGIADIAGFEDVDEICALLSLAAKSDMDRLKPDTGAVRSASRESRAAELASLLENVVSRQQMSA